MEIRIESDKRKLCIYFIIYYYLFTGVFMDLFHMPRSIIYIGDAINIYLFLSIMVASPSRKHYSKALEALLIYNIVGTVIGLFLNLSINSIIMYVWGARNNFRFYIFLYACVLFLNKTDIDRILKKLNWIFVINAVVYAYEWLILKVSGDFLGGIFGITQGCNGRLNLFLCVVCSYNLLRYFQNQMKIWEIAATIVLSLGMAVFSELKVFFFEIAIIMIVIMVMQRISAKVILVSIGGVIALGTAISMINNINDYARITADGTGNFFSIVNIVDYVTKDSGYNGMGTDLNRFTAAFQIYERFFKGQLDKQLFGIGLGGADYSSIPMFISQFYKDYSFLHYQWFQYAWIFLETGIVGLAGYLLIILHFFRKALRLDKKYLLYKSLTIASCILVIISMLYNISMRVESSGYLMFTLLAIPYICVKEQADEQGSEFI